MENRMELPQKTINRTTIGPSNPITGHIPLANRNSKSHVPQCSLHLYLQQPGHGCDLNVHRQMNGYRRCGMYIQWNITQP